MKIVEEVCSSFCFDNGAFSVWKKGGTLDVPGYIAWCEKHCRHPAFDWALIPDTITGSEEENDAYLATWPKDIPGVPVYHFHESMDRLERLVSTYRTVALGSSGAWPNPGTDDWWARMAEVMAVACDKDGRPRCRLHGLRMLNVDIFRYVPLASADSTNATQNSGSLSRFGMYLPPSTATRAAIIAERIEAYQSPAVWTFENQPGLFDDFALENQCK